MENKGGEPLPGYAAALNNLAKCDLDVDSFDTAEAAFREAYAVIRKLKGDGFVNTAAAATNLADCLLRRAEVDLLESNSAQALSRAQEAIELYRRSFDVRTKKFPDGHDSTVVSLSGLARSSLILAPQKEALEYAARGLAMMRKVRRPDHPGMIDVLDTSAQVACSNNDLPAARNFYEQALEIASNNKSIPASRIGEIRGGYGMVLVQLGEADAGLRLLRAAEVAMITAHGDSSIAARLARRQLRQAETIVASQSQNKPD